MDTSFELLRIEKKKQTSSTLIKCTGLLDNKAIAGLEKLFDELVNDEKKRYVFDFSGVVKISQKVINLFIEFAHRLQKNGKFLFIIKLNPNLKLRKNLRPITELDEACLTPGDDDLEEMVEGGEDLYCF